MKDDTNENLCREAPQCIKAIPQNNVYYNLGGDAPQCVAPIPQNNAYYNLGGDAPQFIAPFPQNNAYYNLGGDAPQCVARSMCFHPHFVALHNHTRAQVNKIKPSVKC